MCVILALGYLVAFYLIFHILITCVYKTPWQVVWLWKPFYRHVAHLRKRCNSTASIINAFTTFLLLSFSKNVHPSHYCTPSCKLQAVECHSQECTIFSFTFPTILHSTFCSSQDCSGGMSHVVDFRGGMLCTCMFVEPFQGQYKEPMVLVTSGWFLQMLISSCFKC